MILPYTAKATGGGSPPQGSHSFPKPRGESNGLFEVVLRGFDVALAVEVPANPNMGRSEDGVLAGRGAAGLEIRYFVHSVPSLGLWVSWAFLCRLRASTVERVPRAEGEIARLSLLDHSRAPAAGSVCAHSRISRTSHCGSSE